jgi:O-acetyl-ADP-ribose deacetylase (regulator of RNase III)
MIKIVEGNILEATEDIIGHQVNCQGVMGAGLAKQIRNKYPFAYECYKSYCDEAENKKELMGSIRQVKVDDGKIIAHIFSQYGYGRNALYTDYTSLGKALQHLEIKARNFEESVALPYGIGCGLAGGDWEVVYSMIETIFENYEVTLYKFTA